MDADEIEQAVEALAAAGGDLLAGEAARSNIEMLLAMGWMPPSERKALEARCAPEVFYGGARQQGRRSVIDRLRMGETISASELGLEGELGFSLANGSAGMLPLPPRQPGDRAPAGLESPGAPANPGARPADPNIEPRYTRLSDGELVQMTADQLAKLCRSCGVRLRQSGSPTCGRCDDG